MWCWTLPMCTPCSRCTGGSNILASSTNPTPEPSQNHRTEQTHSASGTSTKFKEGKRRSPGVVQGPTDSPRSQGQPGVHHLPLHYHHSYMNIQDYRDARDSAPSPVPKELVVRIELPLLNSAVEVNMNIEGKALRLKSQKLAYKLQLKLPYLVKKTNGR